MVIIYFAHFLTFSSEHLNHLHLIYDTIQHYTQTQIKIKEQLVVRNKMK
jgi:hypothetical protein